MSYHTTVQDVYRKAAQEPDGSLCCVPQAPQYLPGLHIPSIMHEMNYGCGSTVHPQDMKKDQTVLYVGVGGGLEALQLAYFARRPGAVIAVDPVAEMRDAARMNLQQAAQTNDWFDPTFVDIRDGDALNLPVESGTVDIAAQNCLFNIFTSEDLNQALLEMHRVLKPAGRLVMSDPVSPGEIPDHLRANETLRAQCISGCLTLDRYLETIVEAGFGSIEVRSRRPYRMLDRKRFDLQEEILLETVEVCAYRTPVPADGPCIFIGQSVIYTGSETQFDDGAGHVMLTDVPLPVCRKTAAALTSRNHPDLTITAPTWHYGGGGCC